MDRLQKQDRTVGPEGWEARKVGPRRVEPKRVGGPKFRALFSLSRHIFLSSLSWGCSHGFFLSVLTKVKTEWTHAHMTPWSRDQTTIPVVSLNLMHWRCVAIRAMRSTQIHQGCGNSPGRSASQNGAPPHSPRLFDPSSHECSFLSALANWLRNDVVSMDRRPPTSMPRTTRGALLLGPTSSGYVRSNTTPSRFSAPLCDDPSQWRAHTTVVSTTNWHLPNKGRPSTTTSSLRPSAALGSARSKSRTMMLVVTLPPASLQTLAVALSSANPLRPSTPARAHDADRGKGSRRRLNNTTRNNEAESV